MNQDGVPAADGTGRAADDAASAPKRFAAFISYAHVDEEVAARLHKQIETYRLPKKLRAADGGEAAVRLGSVFRDRADLAAADSLSEAIRAALAASGALIVLCSPAAVQSRWVNEEIRLFRALNPGAPVLAAIARGDPADAMPAALTEGGREPLAADLRDEGDGQKLGFLKIVAALASVPLDALIQRDAQRKLRRVMTVTVGAVVALVVAVSMMTYAIQQRNEANRQREEAERRRTQAEGLVEFMLTDLRGSLRQVGRLDIMRSAVGNALESFGNGSERGALSPDSQGQLARLLHAVGEDDFNASRRDRAEQSFRQAYGITASLLADAPRDPDTIFNHAQSEYWLGFFSYLAGDFDQARPYMQRYSRLAVRLSRIEPGSRRSTQELAYAYGNLCSVTLAQNRADVQSCADSVGIQRQIVRASPTDGAAQITLANRLAWLADALDARDGIGAGDPNREEQLMIVRRLAQASPDDWQRQERLVNALVARVASHIRANRQAEARRLIAEADRRVGEMQRRDSTNQRWLALREMIDEQQNALREERR